MQRRTPLQARLHDSALGFTTSTGRATGAEVRYFVTERMDELSQLVAQVESFMLAPAFVGVFGDPATRAPPTPTASSTSLTG